jgi:hypothetical protein
MRWQCAIVMMFLIIAAACGSDEDVVEEERGPRSIKLVIEGDGTGTVVHDLSLDLPCETADSPCTWNFDPDGPFMTTTLRATPDAGSLFAGWGGDCAGVAPCTITVNDKYDVTATFNLP